MKQVFKDGAKINGMFRSDNGGLTINDPIALKRAVSEKDRIDNMQKQIDGLNNTVTALTEMFKNWKNNGN